MIIYQHVQKKQKSIIIVFGIIIFVKKIIKKGQDPEEEHTVVDCDPVPALAKAWNGRVPCLLATRSKGPWLTALGRRMNPAELMRIHCINFK